MSITITDRKEHLASQLHGSSLNKVRGVEALFERSANKVLSKIDPIDTMRDVPLSSVIFDNIYNYALPSDYRKLIDIFPQAERNNLDSVNRITAEPFNLRKAINSKKISIEGSEGSKIAKINWRSRAPKTLHTMDSLTANGAWGLVATASNIELDTITKFQGNGSIRFDVAVTGDGIENTTMNKVDLTNEDDIGSSFAVVYIKNSTDLANLNSITGIWGNDLTTKFWTGVAQSVQADGTAFKVGWNIIRIPWETATETGTVDPVETDSFRFTFDVDATISDIRIDQITFAVGRNFDIKYYSKYLLQNTAGTWISRTTSDDDIVVLDSDAINILLLEDLIAAAQQVEGTDSAFDVGWAKRELLGEDLRDRSGLYADYRAEYPSMAKQAIVYYGSPPARGRWGRRS